MQNCSWCRKAIIADMAGMNPVFIQFFEGDSFIVHEHCGQEILQKRDKLKTKKAKVNFMLTIAKKMSNGGATEKDISELTEEK